MATARLVASQYSVTGTVVVNQNESSLYTNIDNSSNPARITHTTAGTTSYYLYLKGFNFSTVPSDATVNSISIKIKGYESGLSTSTTYAPRLYNNTSTITGASAASSNFGTSTSTITVPYTGTWDTLSGYGSDLGIRLTIRRSSRNTQGYLYIYGAEITVDYTVATPRTITSTLSGSGTINPSGATTLYDGDEYQLTITPTNKSSTVTVTNNNVDVTDELVSHYTGGTSYSTSSASGSDVTTGFNRSGTAFYQSSSTSSDAWLRYAIGKTAESPYSTTNTSNTYVKDGTNDADTMGWMNYPFVFSSLPDDAEVTSIQVKCYGATESTTESARHADIELYCGDELKSTRQSFTSTSNGTITISDPGTWDREELQNAWVRFIVGYYGGRLLGITWTVNYTSGGTLSHYVYSYEVNGDATIVVTIGGGGSQPKMYAKINGTWTQFSKIYKKVNGSWVEQNSSTWSTLFDTNTNYRKMN